MAAAVYRVGKKPLDMPGEGPVRRKMPGEELTEEEVKSFGPALKRMLERGDLSSETVKAGDLDIPAYPASVVDERIARDRLEANGFDVDPAADRALVYAAHDHILLKRPAKDVAKQHKVDAGALELIAKTRKVRGREPDADEVTSQADA